MIYQNSSVHHVIPIPRVIAQLERFRRNQDAENSSQERELTITWFRGDCGQQFSARGERFPERHGIRVMSAILAMVGRVTERY